MVVEAAFLGRPDFSPEARPNPYFEGFRSDFGAKIWGAPGADPTTTDPTAHSQPSDTHKTKFLKRGWREVGWRRTGAKTQQKLILRIGFPFS